MTSRVLRPALLAFLILIFLILAPSCLFSRAAAENDGYLSVGAIQFAVSEDVYSNADSFRAAVNDALNRLESEAASTASGRPLDLAVFPEYSSAFLGLSFLSGDEIRSLAADPAGSRPLISGALLQAEPEIMVIWSEISRERGYAILAGTTLIVDSDGGIRNRALLFSPAGKLIWTQDKVFPGAPELTLLNLQAGKVSDARSFDVDGFTIVSTICRDTYNSVWEKSLPKADLWIDIKANELPYTHEYYSQALPARLPGSIIDTGLTVSLAGKMLGFHFTGPSEFLSDTGIISASNPYLKNELLIISLPAK